MRQAHAAVGGAHARGDTSLDQEIFGDLRERYLPPSATASFEAGWRDWQDGNHPGYALGCWLRDYKEQVLLFTHDFAVDWTNNISESGAKAAKRHQAAPATGTPSPPSPASAGSGATSIALTVRGLTAIEAIRTAPEGEPWLPGSLPSSDLNHQVTDP